jgi:ATP-dependent DNA helicase RecQ
MVAIGDMLKGVDSEKTRKFGFTDLSTFGLLGERSSEWITALLRALLAAGWIDLTTNEHPVPYLTRAGAEVMKGEVSPRIVLPAEPRSRSRARIRRTSGSEPAPAAIALDPAVQSLFERLRALRAEIAKQRGVPAYVVALDRTLVEMAHVKPTTTDQLLMLHGMGPARADQYGESFLRLLRE